MRPIRSLLLLLIFLACFTGLHYVIPLSQFFPSIFEFVPAALIKSLKSDDKVLNKSDNVPAADSIIQPTVWIKTPAFSNPDTLSNLPVFPLNEFIDSLRYSKGQVRIMYYGDSQIEGDRITSFLRQTLRKGHGGSGPGLFLPLMPVMYTKSLWLRSSSNWLRYNYLSYKAGEIPHRNLGPFMTICRYLPDGVRSSSNEKAFVRIVPSNLADSTSAFYDQLRIFYGNTLDTVTAKVKADGKEVYAGTLLMGKGFNELNCELKGGREVLIEFEGKVSPDIYGISIESLKGVIVDNIPQRGSAGLEFTMVDRSNLREAYRRLSPDLFILHYGLNIVKNVREDYSYYKKGLRMQLSLLKAISPNTPILVVSLTDMALNEGDSIKSYSNIPLIIDAQKQASSEAGAYFWDSYYAMGGKSSIIKWAEKKNLRSHKRIMFILHIRGQIPFLKFSLRIFSLPK